MSSRQLVEYIIRARFEEPAVDQEIVSRTVLTDPDRPTRVLCPTSATWHGRHYATDRRWTIATPEGATVMLCSAVCALSWLVYGLPADLEARQSATPSEAA